MAGRECWGPEGHKSWSLVLKERAGAGRAGAVREMPPPSCDLF